MANHSRDDMKNQGNAGAGLLGLIGALGAAAVAAGVSSSKNNQKITELKNELRSVQNRKASLQGGLLGSIINADEISRLEAKERSLKNEIAKLGG